MSRIVQPDGWERPRGYSNAVIAQGEQIYIAGQIGWNERGEFVSDDFVEQATQALRNIVAILHACGARASDLVRLTWYVTDKTEYEGAASAAWCCVPRDRRRAFPGDDACRGSRPIRGEGQS